jgi:hypothetical protein
MEYDVAAIDNDREAKAFVLPSTPSPSHVMRSHPTGDLRRWDALRNPGYLT